MELKTAVKERRSIRSFKSDPVPESVVSEIITEARWSPSWGNTQSWEIYVVTGETLKKFKEANRAKITSLAPSTTEIPTPQNWPEALKKRYVGVGKSVLGSLQIAREDKQARMDYTADMFSLFGAPCLLLFCFDSSLSVGYAMLDTGLIVQTICLLAQDRGLGTCALAASITYPDLLRELLPIPADRTIAVGVALGYPDPDAAINRFERERAAVSEFVTWVK
ncbi:MAG: nitroreductase [Smithellaceae bacterium]|nr:nitroreductase [Smithellaceae bacterium]